MKNNDVELIHRILDGDETAFSTLIEKYQKQVHALAWRKIGDFHIAEEITQDTFLKVYQKLTTLRKPQRFAGWLYVITTRCCQAWLRKKQIQTESIEEIESEELEPEAYSRYIAEEKTKVTVEAQRRIVKKLLTTLPESERTVITLHYFAEMTCEEMSEFLGVSVNTIKSRLRRARNRLKKEEPMIREAISNFQISPNLTKNIMEEITRLKPTAPSVSKPLIPWVISAASAVLMVLMLGIGSQDLARFQQPYSLDAQSERAIELVDAPIVQNVDAKPDVRNQLGERSDTTGRGNGNGKEANQVLGDEGDYTQRNLPERAKARLSKGRINGINFSPDGTQITVASATGVWIYDVHTGAELALLTDHTSRTGKVVFSPDGRTLATGSNSKILLWNTATGKLLKTFEIEDGVVKALRIIDDGKTLRCDYYDGSVRLWDITTGVKKDFRPTPPRGLRETPRRIGEYEVEAVDLYLNNVDNKGVFAIGDVYGNIWLADAMTGRHLKTLQGHKECISKLIFSPDGTLLVSADYDNVPPRLWDVTTGKLLKMLTKDLGIYNRHILNFSKDGKTLACSATSAKAWSRKIELWDVATKTLRTTLSKTKLDSKFGQLAFSPDSKTVARANQNGEIQVWDVNTGEELSSFKTKHTHGSTTLAFSSDSNILASGQGKTIKLWDTFNFTELSDRIDTDTGFITMVLSPNGGTLTGVSDFTLKIKSGIDSIIESVHGRLHVWETHTGNKLSEVPIESHKGDVPEHPGANFTGFSSIGMYGSTVFSKNGHMLATAINKRGDHMLLTNPNSEWADNQFTVHLWAVPYEKSHATLKGHTKKINVLAFTPNGKMIASGSDDGTIRVWDTGTGTQMLNIPSRKTDSLAFSEDGKILASSDPVNIQLWDVGTGTQLKSLKAKNDSVTVLAFSTDSDVLACGNRDGIIRLWDLSNGNELTTFKGHVDRINALSFSPDGKMLASGSTDGAIFLWGISY